MTAIANKTREPYLDVLKGLAMLGVLLAHFYVSDNGTIAGIQTIGSRCPQLFFIVSAFLTWKVMDKKVDYKKFYEKRFFRIAPLYYVSLLLALLLPTITLGDHSFGDYSTHLLFLNGFVPSWANNIMHVEWYITDLALLYFVCPLLKKVATDLKSSIITLLVATAISSLSIMVTNFLFSEQMASSQAWETYFHTFFLLNQLPIWLMGIVLFYAIKEHNSIGWGEVFIMFLFSLLITVAFEVLHINKHFLSSSFVAGLCFSWMFLLCYKVKDIFMLKVFYPFEWFGKHSFGIYCIHFVTIRTLGYYGMIQVTSMMGWALGLLISIAACSFIGYIIEMFWDIIQSHIKKHCITI